jgi:hypothetical protein
MPILEDVRTHILGQVASLKGAGSSQKNLNMAPQYMWYIAISHYLGHRSYQKLRNGFDRSVSGRLVDRGAP